MFGDIDRWRQRRDKWQEWSRRPEVGRALRFSQYALLAAILAYLAYKLTTVGWLDVINSLPASPIFYLCFFARYFALPISEIPTYEIVWRKPLWRHVGAFVRKRVYNFAVLGYSGEAFFTLWARRSLDLTDRQILSGVKDNNIISALTSNIATVLTLIALAATGGLKAGLDALPGSNLLFSMAFVTALTLALAVMIFRRRIIDLPRGAMPKLVTIHGVRIAIMMALHAMMYAAAIPGAPLSAWFMFIALQLVLHRIPFLPNQDLAYLTGALSLSAIVGAPEATLAGMLVAEAGLAQITNFTLFFLTARQAGLDKKRV